MEQRQALEYTQVRRKAVNIKITNTMQGKLYERGYVILDNNVDEKPLFILLTVSKAKDLGFEIIDPKTGEKI